VHIGAFITAHEFMYDALKSKLPSTGIARNLAITFVETRLDLVWHLKFLVLILVCSSLAAAMLANANESVGTVRDIMRKNRTRQPSRVAPTT
jgi:hypothetical protein